MPFEKRVSDAGTVDEKTVVEALSEVGKSISFMTSQIGDLADDVAMLSKQVMQFEDAIERLDKRIASWPFVKIQPH